MYKIPSTKMTLTEEIDELINTCWDRISVQSNNNGYIFVEKVLDLIIEMENILQYKGLFTTDELKLLRLMIKDKPLLKLYKVDISRFLLRLVQYDDFEKFLSHRANLSLANLRRLLRADRLKSYEEPIGQNRNCTPKNNNQSIVVTPPFSPHLNGKYISDEASDRRYKIGRQENKSIYDLEHEIERLNNYIKSLENRISEKAYNKEIKELIKESKIKSKKIHDLENSCERFQKEILKYQVLEEKKKPIINNLISSLQRQNQLIEILKSKVDSIEDSDEAGSRKTLKNIIRNLPILKQYYLYFKYKNQQKNIGVWTINLITLFLSAVVVIHLVQFILYLFIWVINVRVDGDNIINDDGTILNVESTYSWWREISWLEYFIVEFLDIYTK